MDQRATDADNMLKNRLLVWFVMMIILSVKYRRGYFLQEEQRYAFRYRRVPNSGSNFVIELNYEK